MGVFDELFISVIERLIVIPLDSYMISHGFFVNLVGAPWFVRVIDNFLAILFFFAAYYVTHIKLRAVDEIPGGRKILATIWYRIKAFSLKKENDQEKPIDTNG